MMSMTNSMAIGKETSRIDCGYSSKKELILLISMSPFIVL